MGGLLAALLLTRLVRGGVRRVTGALASAVTGGLAVAAILQFWFGSLDGSYAANTGAIALTVAAIALTILGLESLLGYVGLGLGAATMMLIGNPSRAPRPHPRCCPAGPVPSANCYHPGLVANCCAPPRSSTVTAPPNPPPSWRRGSRSVRSCAW